MSSKKDRMKQRATQGQAVNIDDLLQQAAQWETGALPHTAPTPVEPTDLPVVLITPDPIQPRRAMPELLRARWCDGAPVDGVLVEWDNRVQRNLAEHGIAAQWQDWLDVTGLAARDEGQLAIQDHKLHPDTRLWLAMLRLAASIYQTGLEQPITVYAEGDIYRLLVGERRLLAFHLLGWLGHKAYTTIPAIVRDGYNPFSQALENGARQDLNAIGVARQLAILLKVLNSVDIPAHGQPPQSWYAEATDLNIPRGEADRVAAMLGLPSPTTLRKYRRLLTLPPQVWTWADQFDWTEGRLRGWMRIAHSNEELIRLANDAMLDEIGKGSRKSSPVSQAQRAYRQTQSAVKALQRIQKMSDDAWELVPESEQEALVRLAIEIVEQRRR